MPLLIKLIDHPSVSISVPALRTIGNVVSSDQAEISNAAIEAGIVPLLATLLDHPKPILRKECTWTLANVLAESVENVKMCLQANIIQGLILHLQHDMDMVRRECVWALTNSIQKATPELCSQIIDQKFFTACNYALELKDLRIVSVALEGILIALDKGQ